MFKVTFQLPEYDGINIEVEKSFWTGKPKVWVNGVLAEKAGELRRAFIIPLPDGLHKEIEVDRGGLDYIPRVYIDGQRINITQKLKWYEKAFGLLPIYLIVFGLMGIIFGYFGSLINFKVLRSDKSTAIKIFSVLGVTVSCFVLNMILAFIVYNIFGLIKK